MYGVLGCHFLLMYGSWCSAVSSLRCKQSARKSTQFSNPSRITVNTHTHTHPYTHTHTHRVLVSMLLGQLLGLTGKP